MVGSLREMLRILSKYRYDLFLLLLAFVSLLVIINTAEAAKTDNTLESFDPFAISSSFDLYVHPTYRQIRAGESAHYYIDLVKVDPSFTADVYLKAFYEPPASTVTFTDNPISPSPGDDNSVMIVDTSSSTPPGVYTITIRGEDSTTGDVIYEDVTLEVLPAYEPDFSLALYPAQLEVNKGEEASFTVQAIPQYGFTEPIYLRLAWPTGVTHSFSPNPMYPWPYYSTLTIDTSNLAPGEYTVAVDGCHGLMCRRACAKLIVKEFEPQEVKLIVYPIFVKVKAGDTFHLRVNVGITGGKAEPPLTLRIVGPTGWYIGYYDNTIEGTEYLDLWVTVPKGTPAGTYGIIVELYQEGNLLKSRSVKVDVEERNPQLSLSIIPSEITLTKDSPNAQIILMVNVTNNGIDNVQLSVVGAPAGISYSLPPLVKPGEMAKVNLSLSGAKNGDYTIVFAASAEGRVAQSSLVVHVRGFEEVPKTTTVTVVRSVTVTQTKTVERLPTTTSEVPVPGLEQRDLLLIGLSLIGIVLIILAILLLRRGGTPPSGGGQVTPIAST